MATTDNKVLSGAGVEQLSQLVKNAIAQGGGTEYSAGQGIEISSENEISTAWSGYTALAEMLGLSNADSWEQASSMEDFMKKLRKGKKMQYQLGGSNAYRLWDDYGITKVYAVYQASSSEVVRIFQTRADFYNSLSSKPWYWLLIDDHTLVASWLYSTNFSNLMQCIPYNNATSGLTATTIKGAIDELAASMPDIATTQTPGTVIPDGTSITIDSNGVISSQGGGAEYTAGPGIEISSENEISRTAGQTLSPILLGGLQGLTNSDIITLLSNNLPQATDADTFISLCKEQVLFNNTYGEGWTGSQFTAFKNSLGVQNLRKISISGDGSVNVSAIQYYFNPDYVYYLFEKIGTVGYFYTVGNLYNLKYLPNAIQYDNTTSSLAATTMKNAIDELATKIPTLATTQTAGIVKPDGTTITVDENGVISSQGGGGSSFPTDPSTDGTYKLVNTVATVEGTQTASQSWQEDAGYTAGIGVSIDSNNVITTHQPFGSSYMQLFGFNSGASSFTDINNLKNGEYSLFGVSPYSPSQLRSQLGLSYILKIPEDGTVTYISSFTSTPSEWNTWTEARWIYINHEPNGKALIWAQNMNALNAWLSRRCRVSSTALTATNVYTAIDELATTRVPSALVSTDTAPTVNNTINWVYK